LAQEIVWRLLSDLLTATLCQSHIARFNSLPAGNLCHFSQAHPNRSPVTDHVAWQARQAVGIAVGDFRRFAGSLGPLSPALESLNILFQPIDITTQARKFALGGDF
jgi:hypothetical protein